MKNDNLRRYIELRESLVQEKAALEKRLRAINEALGQAEATLATQSTAPTTESARTRGRGGARGGISLREAVLQLTSQRPMTKQEILEGVKALGYKFSTKDPLNSLGTILYGKNPKFKNQDGRFSPVGSAGGRTAQSSGANSPTQARKRQMSPEARARIAAAQRARWAKARNGK